MMQFFRVVALNPTSITWNNSHRAQGRVTSALAVMLFHQQNRDSFVLAASASREAGELTSRISGFARSSLD